MALLPVAATIEELINRFSREEIKAMVRARHPKRVLAERSPFAFFLYTYEEVYGTCSCDLSRQKVQRDYLALCGSSDSYDLPDYYVRCLVDGYRGSA